MKRALRETLCKLAVSEPDGAGETDGLSVAAVPGLISKRDKSGQLCEPSGPDEEARVYDGITEISAVLAGDLL